MVGQGEEGWREWINKLRESIYHGIEYVEEGEGINRDGRFKGVEED